MSQVDSNTLVIWELKVSGWSTYQCRSTFRPRMWLPGDTHYTAGITAETPKSVGAVKLLIVTNTNPYVVLFKRAHKNSSCDPWIFQIALDLSIHNINGYDGSNNIFPIKTTVKFRFICVLSCSLGHFYRFIFSYRCVSIGIPGRSEVATDLPLIQSLFYTPQFSSIEDCIQCSPFGQEKGITHLFYSLVVQNRHRTSEVQRIPLWFWV